MHKNQSKKPQIFYQLKVCGKVLFSIYTLKKMSFIASLFLRQTLSIFMKRLDGKYLC